MSDNNSNTTYNNVKIVMSNTKLNELLRKKLIVLKDTQYYLKCYNEAQPTLDLNTEPYVLVPITVQMKTTIRNTKQPDVFNDSLELNADNIETWIDTHFRVYWKNTRLGSLGYRELCVNNMTKFMRHHPHITVDDISKASKLYVESLYKRYGNYTYLDNADNFIYKMDNNHKILKSRLLLFIECLSDNYELTNLDSMMYEDV